MKKLFTILAILIAFPISIYSQWIQLTSPSTNDLYCTYFINASTGYLSGNTNGTVIKTTDGGTSWIFSGTGTTSTFFDLLFVDALNGFAGGTGKQVLKTTNAGVNWTIKTGGSGNVYSISFPTAATGYAVGGNPTTLDKSTDGGNNWTSLAPPTTNTLRGVYFVSNVVGWVCGYYGNIWKTTDGSISWTPEIQSNIYGFEKITFPNAITGYVAGAAGIIMKTTNAGSNWFLQPSGLTTGINDLFFVNVSTGWAVGLSGKIIKTTDGGTTWVTQVSPSSSASYYAIHMADANTGYIVGSGGILLKTSNGGITPYFTKITNDPLVLDNGYFVGAYPCDYDNDGNLDVVLIQYNDACFSCNYPVMLFHNNGNGSFTRVTTGPIANLVTKAFSATWGDYDNDGKPDLFITRGFNMGNLLFHNEGSGNFTQITSGPIATDAGDGRGCAWIDYDRDGWLDLFVCNQSNQSNFLYHNNGDGTFTKVTSGSIVTDVGWSRGCAWGDYDNDRWPDLYVCNYNNLYPFLYHNNGDGTFTRVYNTLTQNPRWGTTCAWGDYNNDGWLDLAVTNSNQNNQLFQNLGNGNFVLSNTIVSYTGGATSNPAWEDYDNDGYPDLFVARTSGYNLLYHNALGTSFSLITNELLTLQNGASGSWFDYNNDGKVDILVPGFGNTPNSLFKNNGATGNYLTVKLHGCNTLTGRSNTMGIGARVKIRYGSTQQIRDVGANNTNNMLWQHFGLGSVTLVDSVIVYWTSGNIQRLTNVTANQIILVDECLVGIAENQNQIPSKFELMQNYPNPFNPVTRIKFQLPSKSFVNLTVYDINGREVQTLLNSEKPAGYYELTFDGENYSSGIYLYKIVTDNNVDCKKMVLIK